MKQHNRNLYRLAGRPGQQAAVAPARLRDGSVSVNSPHGEENILDDSSERPNDEVGPKPSGRPTSDSVACKPNRNGLFRAGEAMYIGTWNVRTLGQDGSTEILLHQLDRMKWSIIGICETRWIGMGINKVGGTTIIHSGNEKGGKNGVGLILSKVAEKALTDYNPISDRILTATFNSHAFPIKIIQVYAPTSSCSDNEIDQFYEILENEYQRTPKNHIVILMGDFNAKVGSIENESVGKYGIGELNDRGELLQEFCAANNLMIMNTYYQHSFNQKWTWEHPDGVHKNMIDFVIVPRRWKNCVQDCRSFPSVVCDTDHQLVMAKFKLKLKMQRQNANLHSKLDYDDLKDWRSRNEFELELKNRFAPLDPKNLEEMTQNFTKVVVETAYKILPVKRKRTKPWISTRTLELSDQRRKAKGDPQKAKDLRRDIKASVREDQQEWIDDLCDKADQQARLHNSGGLHQIVKEVTRGFKTQSVSKNVKDKDGKLLTGNKEIKERWREYSNDLYNHDLQVDEKVLDGLWQGQHQEKEPDILKSEVERAIRKLKCRKAAGHDGITAEMIQAGGETVIEQIHEICQKAWELECFPTEWTRSVIVTIYKKGDRALCNNYRTISLISHASKVLLEILRMRLKPRIEEMLPETQAGFRANRSTIDQIFALKMLVEKHLELNDGNGLKAVFVDFKKAFDRVWHKALFKIMSHHNLPRKLVALIKDLYFQASSAVRMGEDLTDWFKQSVGVRQGCLLSPDLFNIFLEFILADALDEPYDTTPTVNGVPVNNLKFADDIALMDKTNVNIQALTQNVDRESRKFGMEISIEKTKYIHFTTCKSEDSHSVTLGNIEMEKASHFKYLGYNFNESNDTIYDVKIKTAIALGTLGKLNFIWNNRNFTLANKMKLLKSLVFPIALYGCEAWTMSKNVTKKLDAFQMKCLRRITNVKWQDHVTNEEVRTRCDVLTNMSKHVMSVQTRWFGHVCRMDANRIPKIALQGKINGKRRKGRPKMRWEQPITKAADTTFGELIRLAENRQEWRTMVYGGYVPRNVP